MRKFLLLLGMCFLTLSVTAESFSYMYRGVKFECKLHKQTVSIACPASAADIVIPAKVAYKGQFYPVKKVRRVLRSAKKPKIESLVIEEGIEEIENLAFYYCKNLNRVTLPSSLRHIGSKAFYNTNMECHLPPNIDELTLKNGVECWPMPLNVVVTSNNVSSDSPISNTLSELQSTIADVDVDLPISNKQNDEMFAVIIANENYQKVSKVDCALNDGRTFQLYCQRVLGIPSDNIHMIEDATYGQMMEEFNWLARVAKAYEGDAKIIVYYAGHGIPNESSKTSYLLPVDVSGDNTTAAFSLNKLYASLGALNAKNVTLFMDACFSGSLRGDGMLTAARSVAIEAKAENPLGNMIVFSAAQGDETAYPYPEKGHGLFTYYLLKKLKETKGNVNLGTLGDYIRKEVARKSIVVNNKPQTPTISYSSTMKGSWRNITLK